jgi:15-cis-phytoene synthase
MASPPGRQPSGGNPLAPLDLAWANEPRHQPDMNEAIATLVRRHDPDRFLTALFAPPDRRDALLTLYAFNHELARAREVASQPPLALIRLQWWREVVEGQQKRHEVAWPLSEVIAAGLLKPTDLLPIIEAREAEAYGDFETMNDWREWLLAGSGGLAVAAATALGASEPEVFRHCGAAYGAAGLLRTSHLMAAQERCLLPRDMLLRHGLSPEAFIHDPASAAARAALDDLVLEGQAQLDHLRGISLPRLAIAAALPAALARRDLARRTPIPAPRGLRDRLAVVFAGITGRL